jgi:CRISPR-associated protein Cas1
MATLYLDRSGVELRDEGASVAIYVGGERQRSLPLNLLDRIVIFGNTVLSSRLLARLAARNIGVAIVDRRTGDSRVSTVWLGGGDAARRLAQYRAYQDMAWRTDWARRLVGRKLASQRRLLLHAAEERPAERHRLLNASATLAQILERLHSEEPLDLAVIMGLEGAAAHAYFSAYAALFAPALGFTERNRRPPRDPVNACLSLAYTLAHHQACVAIAAAGLDPAVGFYHETAHGRESLACDLVELLRPHVDAWVWEMFRSRVLRPEHFRRHAGACLLGKAGRAAFYEEHERFAGPAARRLRRLTRLLVRALTGEASPAEIGEDAAEP